jgi:hypothetical protein
VLHSTQSPLGLPSLAAGAPLTYTIPGAVEQLVISASFTYTASGAAGNRTPFIRFLDQSGSAFCEVATPFLLIATNVCRVTFGVGIVQFGANSAARIGAGIPAMRLGDGLRVQLGATAQLAADTITGARLFVRQWPVQLGGHYHDGA